MFYKRLRRIEGKDYRNKITNSKEGLKMSFLNKMSEHQNIPLDHLRKLYEMAQAQEQIKRW